MGDKGKHCILCGNMLFEKPLVICENMPSEAQNLPMSDGLQDEKAISYNVCQCSGCGLIQFDCEPVSYYLDSTRAGERCEQLIELRQMQYSHLIETFHLHGKKILEIGAGRGGFLRTLKEMTEYGIHEYGIEYNPDFVKTAREDEGVNVIQGNPEDECLILEEGPFDAFTSFAYPARLMHPNAMMRLAYNNLSENGIGFIQVASLEHLLRKGGFYDITRDHMAYYDKRTLRILCEVNGFDVLEEGEAIDTYIYAIVRKRLPTDLSMLNNDADRLGREFKNYIKQCNDNGKKIAVWCAGHYAFTVLSATRTGRDEICYIVDNAPFKQGRYSPASHIPIVAPDHFIEEPVDEIIILGPIYIDEIVKEIRKKCSMDVEIAAMDRNGIRKVNVTAGGLV